MRASKTLYILNGPNLNLLGQREPELYGYETLETIEKICRNCAESAGHHLIFRQTNHEGALIDWIHECHLHGDILIINAAGFSHTSVSVYDALKILKIPIIEVHLSQPLKREAFRQHSYVSLAAQGIIAGFGINSYKYAVEAALTLMSQKHET